MDVSGGSTAESAAVIQYPDKGSTNQQWKLVKPAETQASSSAAARCT
ncbi:RICIN domain-containing protein [Streptomyces sp. NBC_00503]|nr:RICIN domain-containing protein [Streptomyces sp. NBC_00503]WUD86273.1 RICIN domain-containing protein [Streptomyces sp. NBC_00503]